MKTHFKLCLFLLCAPFVSTSAVPSTCLEFYLKRNLPPNATLATECWKSAGYPVEEREDALIALGWISRKSHSREMRIKAAGEGLALISIMELEGDETVSFWKAVFLSFEAQAQDDGGILPKNMLRAIPTIRTLLKQAIEISPMVLGYGPSRILGILELSLPAILKGSAKDGAVLVGDAYRNAPEFSQNMIWQAKVWARFSRKEEAKVLLAAFLAQPPPPTAKERLDFEEDHIEARTLLESLR